MNFINNSSQTDHKRKLSESSLNPPLKLVKGSPPLFDDIITLIIPYLDSEDAAKFEFCCKKFHYLYWKTLSRNEEYFFEWVDSSSYKKNCILTRYFINFTNHYLSSTNPTISINPTDTNITVSNKLRINKNECPNFYAYIKCLVNNTKTLSNIKKFPKIPNDELLSGDRLFRLFLQIVLCDRTKKLNKKQIIQKITEEFKAAITLKITYATNLIVSSRYIDIAETFAIQPANNGDFTELKLMIDNKNLNPETLFEKGFKYPPILHSLGNVDKKNAINELNEERKLEFFTRSDKYFQQAIEDYNNSVPLELWFDSAVVKYGISSLLKKPDEKKFYLKEAAKHSEQLIKKCDSKAPSDYLFFSGLIHSTYSNLVENKMEKKNLLIKSANDFEKALKKNIFVMQGRILNAIRVWFNLVSLSEENEQKIILLNKIIHLDKENCQNGYLKKTEENTLELEEIVAKSKDILKELEL